jgi:hypothetical protein
LVRSWRTIAGIGFALLFAPPAAATPRDETSAHTFLTATAHLLHTAIARRQEQATLINGLIGQVDSDCPHTVPASLQAGPPAQQHFVVDFDAAIEGEVILAEVHPLRSAYGAFSQAVVHLQWSDQGLARRIAVAIAQARAVAALHGPDLCHQAKLARVSNFTRTPPAIRTFVRHFAAATSAQSSTTEELEQLVKPLASPDDLPLVRQVHQLQARVNRIIAQLALRGVAMLTRALSG